MSINEIAKQLNVSKSTVSLVINGKSEKGRISKALTKKILDYVAEIGYKPNALAQSLATGKSSTIGLIVENIGDSFFGPIALHIEEYLRDQGYHVLYSSTLGDSGLAQTIFQTMLDKKVDGIILAPTLGLEEVASQAIETNIPLVIFDRKISEIQTNYVGTDNYACSKLAVEHLYEQGFREIGFVTITSDQSQMKDRQDAYLAVVQKENKLPYILQTTYAIDTQLRIQHIADFLMANPQLDALYFSTNYLCVSGLKAIQNLGKTNDYGLISFDDHELFDLLQPTISCIHQPLPEIAEKVVTLLLQQLQMRKVPAQEYIIPSELIIRGSSLR